MTTDQVRFLCAESSKGQQSLKCDYFASQFDARGGEDLFESFRHESTLSSKMCAVNCTNLFCYQKDPPSQIHHIEATFFQLAHIVVGIVLQFDLQC